VFRGVHHLSIDPKGRMAMPARHRDRLQAISAGFRRAGVRKLRTLLARDNTLILSFFRSQGLMAGALMSLEIDLDD